LIRYVKRFLASKFIEQPNFQLHDVYRALSVLAEESDLIQSMLYENSLKVLDQRKDILYYDCTNFYFELEQADDFRKYGKSGQHQPLPLVGMGLFMDYDGIPLAFDIYPGNKNEQPTLKTIEKRVLQDYGLEEVIVCTDAGLSSKTNRKFNDRTLGGERMRSFITTQSIKQLPEYIKDFALDPNGWHLINDSKTYNLNELDEEADYNKIFYKDRWIKEDLSSRKIKEGTQPLEQHLVVSFSLKYLNYQRKIRQGQIDRAMALIESGKYKQRPKNQNDPHRFIKRQPATADGEICSQEAVYLDVSTIENEQKYDGFYAVCTNLDDIRIDEIIKINKKRWEIEECFRIMKTEFKARPVYLQRENHIKAHFITCFIALFVYRILEKKVGEKYTCEQLIDTMRDMIMERPGNGQGYIPIYTRTKITDALHETAGFRTDYEILTDISMKKVIRLSKGKKK
jgi:transposase